MPFLLFFILFFLKTFDASAAMQPKQIKMENGLTVLLIERHSLPVVSVVALVKSGAIHDPPHLAGTANFMASLLDEGTTTRTSIQISEAIDFMGASLSVSTQNDSITAHLRILKKHLEEGVNLLSDIMLHPRFDPKEVERVRKLITGSIHAEKDDPMVVASRALDRLVFGNHPYGLPVIGEVSTVEKIQRDDLAHFHQAHFSARNTILTVVGDITEKETVAWVKKYFSTWGISPGPSPEIAPPTARPAKQDLIDKPLTQSSIRIGHLGIHRNNPDFYPVIVMNYILGGGGFSSRLLKKIRDDQGLVYSIYSNFDTHQQPGSFTIAMQTQTAHTQKAITAVLDEVKKMRTDMISETELSEAKAYLMGSFPLRMETTHTLAEILAQVGFYELGLTYFEDYPKQIGNVTREDVLRVAKTYLHPDQFQKVIVGNLAEIDLTTP